MERMPRVLVLLLCLSLVACGGGPTAPPTEALPATVETSPGEEAIPPQTVVWIRENGFPFDTTQPDADYGDLVPLKEIVGDARIVALGEATHGTHEFFQPGGL
jgi:hypothetical protein